MEAGLPRRSRFCLLEAEGYADGFTTDNLEL